MNLTRTLILFPCYQWDDFPRSLPDRQAAGLLAGWTILWHPYLLAATNQLPQWCRADQPTDQWENVLAVLPTASESRYPDQIRDKIVHGGGRYIPCYPTRHEMLIHLEQEGIIPANTVSVSTDVSIEDFFALGYCYLQVQLMTRQLRYSTHLDQAVFEEQCLQAAKAFLDGQLDTAKQMLQSCFDQLGQERDHFYSHDTHVLEVILLAPTTLGAKLDEELTRSVPLCLLASSKLLEELKRVNPSAFSIIAERLKQGSLSIIGGSYSDLPHPLLDAESVQRDLSRGLKSISDSLNYRPQVFGRYRDGVTAHFPSHLKRLGFQGCLLAAWESGSYPEASQVKSAWEGCDGIAIDTLTGAVVDGANADTFFGMGTKLGQSLDHDHTSTLVVAHWPGRKSEFIADHARTAVFTPALGRWTTADRYFEITAHPYHQERLSANEFKPDFLNQSIASSTLDPISSITRFHQLASSLRQAQALHVLIDQLNAMTRSPKPIGPATESTTSKNEAFTEKQEPEISGLWERIDQQLQQSANISSIATEELGNSVRNCVNKGLQQMATVITAGTKGTEAGVMVVNTSLVSRRHHWTAPQGIAAAESTQSLYAQLPVGSTVRTVLDMPPCGYFWSAQSDPSQSPRGRLPRSANLASADATLGNEFMEVQIDRATGHLKALHVPKKRGNRISSQLSMFDPRGAGTSEKPYSVMKATQVTMGQSSPVYGEVSAIGGLWFEREKVAEFQIAYQLWRGSRVLYLHIDLDVKRKLLDDPWASYLALRTAFASDSAVLFGTVGGSRQTLPRGRFISPSYVEIDEVDHRTTLLLGGLAYHRRYSERFLDSLLVVKGESASSFKIGIGVDLPEPTIAAETFLEQPLKMDGVPGLPRSGAVNWFFVAEPPQALVQLQSTLVDEAGQIRGVRLFVREVAGKLTSSRIRCLRDVGEAYRSDYQGKSLGKLTVEQDAVLITLSANEQCLVDIIWQTNTSVA